MSKSDAMRAMREARYARSTTAVPTRRAVTDPDGAPATAGSPTATAAPKAKAPRAAEPKSAAPKKAASQKAASQKTEKKSALTTADEPAVTGIDLCGHKSMNGRACTREAGHPEKSHRYS